MKLHDKKKLVWAKDFESGKIYEDFIGAVKQVRGGNTTYQFVVFDKSGEVEAEMPVAKLESPLAEGIYVFTLTVVMLKGHKTAIVKKIRLADPITDAYNALDFYTGLSPEKIEIMKKVIGMAIGSVEEKDEKHIGYGRLLRLYFTEEEFAILASRPASVNGVGRYLGGALSLIANIATLTKDIAVEIARLGNGIYGQKTDYAMMISACLLSMSGMGEYVGDDLKKTTRGYARGYYSLMQSRLENLFDKAELAEEGRDKLLNTLHCMFPGAGALKSVTLESSICRAVFAMYSEIDEVSAYLAESPSEEDIERGYRYSGDLHRPFLIYKDEEQAEGGENNEKVS